VYRRRIGNILQITIILLLILIFHNVNAQETITLSGVLESSVEVSNYMEEYRAIPDTVIICGNELNSAQVLSLFSGAVLYLDDSSYIQYDTILNIYPPENPYPNILIDEALFSNAIDKGDYIGFCSNVYYETHHCDTMPTSCHLLGDSLRYSETIHFISGILRFVRFFGYLPKHHELMVTCPTGLVPWNTPQSYEEYTSMVTGWVPYNFIRYYYYSPGKYSMYSRAIEALESESDYYLGGEKIFDWIISYWYQAGYYIYIRTFGSRMSADEHLRHNLQNSAFHFQDMNGMFRSLGIAASETQLYSTSHGEWINTDVHHPYGSEPSTSLHDPPWDDIPLPSCNDRFILGIRETMSYSGTDVSGFKSIWVNPTDISIYGAEYIVSTAKAGGFTAIILTVKTELGNLYYPTTSFSDRLEFDAISALITSAASEGIEVHAGFSVLADRLTLSQNMGWRNMREVNPDTDYYYPNVSISPCISDYLDTNFTMLSEISQISGLDGIVLAHLYWNTTSYAFKMGGNPACFEYQNGEGWQQNLLSTYLSNLVDTIKSYDTTLSVTMATYPIQVSAAPTFFGHQDFVDMSSYVDRIIFIYDGNFWLIDKEDWTYSTPVTPEPYDIEGYISNYTAQINIPVIVSQNITDEWEFAPLFYSGLLGRVKSLGAEGINLHSPASMLGEFGVSFTPTQYQKISEVNFSESYSDYDIDGDTIITLIDNCPLTYNPLQEDTDNDMVGDSCDNCVTIYNPDQVDLNENEIGDACEFFCGDANDDGVVNIFDITFIISYLYLNGLPPDPLESADVNNDSLVNIFDITYLISYLYLEGLEPTCP